MKDDANDERLSGLYRETAGSEPPEHLDRAILAAARRAVEPEPRPASPFAGRWQVPASLAAVLLVTVLLVPLLTERMDEPAAPEAASPAGALQKKSTIDSRPERNEKGMAAPEADAVGAPGKLLRTPAAPAVEIRRSRPASPADTFMEAERPASRSVGRVDSVAEDDGTEWLERIGEMLEAGDEAGAMEQLRVFVQRYPQYRLPADLQALMQREINGEP